MAKFVGVVLFCRECGSPFKVSQNRRLTAKYCSKACADRHRGDLLIRPRVSRRCPECGGTFHIIPSQDSYRKYCSVACKHGNKQYLLALSERTKQERNPQWGGGVTTHTDGYLYERGPDHPFASNGYVLQHRLVMERHLRANDPTSEWLVPLGDNTYLDPEISVHHRNHDRKDNRIENLQCLTKSEHSSLHNQLRLTSERKKGDNP